MDTKPQTLNHLHVHKLRAYLNNTYSLLNSIAIISIFNYRISIFLNKTNPTIIPSWPCWLLLSLAELLFSFIWILRQPLYWRSVTRTAFPERLPEDTDLPGIDVLIFTTDPKREPTFEVMNTVISAMALDYPGKKLSVYLSDDGGDFVTLMGLKEAWSFATWWLPFVNKYNVKPPSPMAYFDEEFEVDMECHSMEFYHDRKFVKEKYDVFKQRVQNNMTPSEVEDEAKINAQDHSALVELVDANSIEDNVASMNSKYTEMPLLAYVAREKRTSHPHNFKAGAINVLLRISSIISNSPYILILDCDMHCNDSISARQAMCFFLDPNISPSLGWVQFPQRFHNVDANDIYDYQMKDVLYQGLDGLQGPWISGTNVYIKRETLYGINANNGNNLGELRDYFGPSNDFIKSINHNHKGNRDISAKLQQEAKFLASSTYEKGTRWGEEVGFQYFTTSEDVMTSFFFHSKGWRSIYLSPTRPQFLGLATSNLNDVLTQGIRLYSGLLLIGLSKYCPLIYGPSKMRFHTKMCYSWIVLRSFEVLPLLCFATIPPLCLFYGIPLYPKVSDPSFIPFSFIMVSSQVKSLYECSIDRRSASAWFSEQRIWMIRAVTSHAYGVLNCLMIKLRIREASFIPTDKAGDVDKTKYYHLGKYDFRTSNMFLVPIVTVVILNMVCFVGGVAKMIIIARDLDKMFVPVASSLYFLVMSFPVIEGMILRIDDGRVPSSVTLISSMVCMVFLVLAYLLI